MTSGPVEPTSSVCVRLVQPLTAAAFVAVVPDGEVFVVSVFVVSDLLALAFVSVVTLAGGVVFVVLVVFVFAGAAFFTVDDAVGDFGLSSGTNMGSLTSGFWTQGSIWNISHESGFHHAASAN